MAKLSKEFWVAFGVSAMIFLLVWQETSPHGRRPDLLEGSQKIAAWAEESDRHFRADTLRLQAVMYDSHLQAIRRLQRDANDLASAGAYARQVLTMYYRDRLKEFEKDRNSIDLQMGKLVNNGASDDLVAERFAQLTAPWKDAEAKLRHIEKLPDTEAVTIASRWLEENYKHFMQLAQR